MSLVSHAMAKRTLGPFATTFLAQLDKIEEEAKAMGLNMTVICRGARVSRAGPVRWRRRVPRTIALIDRMAAVVEKHKARPATP